MAHTLSLARAKKLFTPAVSILLILLTVYFPLRPFPWRMFDPPNYGGLNSLRWVSWGAFGLGVFGLVVLAEVLAYIVIGRLHIDPIAQSFISAVTRRDYYGILVQFPAILLVEEILFRGFLLAWLSALMPFLPAVVVSSALFGVYHLHIYLSSRQWPITCVYIGYSFFLGLGVALFFPLYGVIGAWMAHLAVVIYVYFRWLMKMRRQRVAAQKIESEKNEGAL